MPVVEHPIDSESAVVALGHDVVVADYSLPDGTSLDILPQVKKLSEETPFVILTAHGSIDLAVRAIKDGASTPMEVEVHAYNYRNRHTAKVRQRSRLESTKALVDGLDGKSTRAKRRKAA